MFSRISGVFNFSWPKQDCEYINQFNIKHIFVYFVQIRCYRYAKQLTAMRRAFIEHANNVEFSILAKNVFESCIINVIVE